MTALREPTERMKRCGDSYWSGFCTGDVRQAADRLWRTMLAEAERAAADGKGE